MDDSSESGFERARRFHVAMGIAARDHVHGEPYEPTEDERILRAKLLFEETMETIRDGLGIQITVGRDDVPLIAPYVDFEVFAPYDPVETLDGLADVKVIANGTAVFFGLPMLAADKAVYDSNMSKLDENGKPTINGITPGYRDLATRVEQDDNAYALDEEGFDPTKPIGKVLKGALYEPAFIGALIHTEESCPGHVAHKEDSMRCKNCGIHINELRP